MDFLSLWGRNINVDEYNKSFAGFIVETKAIQLLLKITGKSAFAKSLLLCSKPNSLLDGKIVQWWFKYPSVDYPADGWEIGCRYWDTESHCEWVTLALHCVAMIPTWMLWKIWFSIATDLSPVFFLPYHFAASFAREEWQRAVRWQAFINLKICWIDFNAMSTVHFWPADCIWTPLKNVCYWVREVEILKLADRKYRYNE